MAARYDATSTRLPGVSAKKTKLMMITATVKKPMEKQSRTALIANCARRSDHEGCSDPTIRFRAKSR